MNPPAPPRHWVVDRLAVEVHSTRAALGLAAARAAARCLQAAIAERGLARVIFACAPSQDEFLAALSSPAECGVALDWRRVHAFHMDEYVGLPAADPRSFRSYLRRHLLDRVAVGSFHALAAEREDLERVCADYAARLHERPIDLACLGIGENGHLAFNDPPGADFDDPVPVRVVALDARCRRQQVNDACFATIAEVPTHALTLTIPVFRQARQLGIQVPGTRKAAAVRAALCEPISRACPASILRTHPHATLHLDPASAGEL